MPSLAPAPAPDLVERFRTDLEDLTGGPPALLAVAVSGGPDSLALLLLAQAAYPGAVRAATVDHRLRPESAAEAAFVAALCADLRVPHATLAAPPIPRNSIQARAREARYELLSDWLGSLGGSWLATAHHLEDQAETLLMRLNRGSGAAGLAAIRRKRPLSAGASAIRPLLGWRKAELAALVAAADIAPVDDPSNRSPDYDRTAIRALLGGTPALDPARLAASASHLADAEEALEWITDREWNERARSEGDVLELNTANLPDEIVRRLAARAIAQLRGSAGEWRRDKLAGVLDRLDSAPSATIAEIHISARGATLRFEAAPPRRSV